MQAAILSTEVEMKKYCAIYDFEDSNGCFRFFQKHCTFAKPSTNGTGYPHFH